MVKSCICTGAPHVIGLSTSWAQLENSNVIPKLQATLSPLSNSNMGLQPIKRTGSYPLHDSDFVPHPDHAQAAFEDPHVRLPRTIRALREAHDSKRHPRTVVICLDGTGDRFDNDNSNIVHFVSCLKKHSPQDQVTYYQSGIGTYDQGGLQNGFRAAMDMAVGSGLGIVVLCNLKWHGIDASIRHTYQGCI